MQRCLQLAGMGRGHVAPNPMVGCVIVHEDKIIGEGFHRQYGGPHAEVNAINSVENPELLNEATVYVSLEPCSHFGKTPPCANLLVKHKVKKVVIGCTDPNAKVAGKGIAILKAANIEVETGMIEKECQKMNERFFTFHEKKRPFIILKWAETKDGFIGAKQQQISGIIARTLLHLWRTEEAAFMVGTNTLLQDNPALSVRYVQGRNPIRIAIDRELKSEDRNLHFYDHSQATILLNGIKNEEDNGMAFIKMEKFTPLTICTALFEKNIQSVVIEGGSELLKSFINASLWDELRVFKSKALLFEDGLASPEFEAKTVSVQDLEEDILTIYHP